VGNNAARGKDMANSPMSEVLQHLRRTKFLQAAAGMTDGQLLECFLSRREEAAVEALVGRHGPMVWGVCRRILRNEHDAEDAFQATFLVLVRKAASIVPREMVANWLHGVAYQTARKARALAAKRKGRERQVTVMPEPRVVEQDRWHDLQPLLDQELSRLPEKYRVVLLLCDLEGKTRKEAARQLGCPEGTVAGRLARARVLLAKRLARLGFAGSGGALAAALAQGAASGCVPPAVVSATVKAASLMAAGRVAAGVIPVQVAVLTEGVLKTMHLTKLKAPLALLLLLGLMTAGTGLFTYGGFAAQRAETRREAEDEPPANRDNGEDQDLLQEQRMRILVEEQRLTQLIDDGLRKARSTYPNDPAAALKLLRDSTLQVWDNPDIGDRVRDDLLRRLVATRRKLSLGEEDPPEKKDRQPTWDLELRVKNPRVIAVDVPGKGRKAVWYCWYEVFNPTNEAHTFLPDFQLVAGEKVYHDELLPKAEEVVHRLEDPAKFFDLKNSVTIANEPIAPLKKGAGKKGVAGMAFWEDVDPENKSVTLFVSGLSNAWTSDGYNVKRKMFKLRFQRVEGELRPTGLGEWVYRSPNLGEETKKDEQAEIEKLIKRLEDGKDWLELGLKDWDRKRELLNMQIQLTEREIEQAAADKKTDVRAELKKKKEELEREYASYEPELTTRSLALEWHRQRLEELRRLRRGAGKPPQK
jgi:RNA polymerase sigma factor (sigma-70 family)